MGQILAKVKAVDGREPNVAGFMEAYGLTEGEGASFTRMLGRIWGGLEADFLYSGPALVEPSIRDLL